MEKDTILPYFKPLLPWQQNLWQQLTSKTLDTASLPHAMLASGMVGIGKRAFVWRWVAWQLCHNRETHLEGACGTCESCLWLAAGTHPDLAVLPHLNLLKSHEHEVDDSGKAKKSKQSNKAKGKATAKPSIKIDDIRTIQDFVTHGSENVRICVFDEADTMTLGAANALLKTLEEPNRGVQLILMTDKPNFLLPTIKSRVQQLPLTDINQQQAIDYVSHELNADNGEQIKQLLQLTSNAPLAAVSMAKSNWYTMRELWLNTWLAIRSGSRSAITASEYWQTQLELNDFIKLAQLMLLDIQRLICGLNTYQQDIDYTKLSKTSFPTQQACDTFLSSLQDIQLSLNQNIQEKIAYDEIMHQLSNL